MIKHTLLVRLLKARLAEREQAVALIDGILKPVDSFLSSPARQADQHVRSLIQGEIDFLRAILKDTQP